MDRIAQIAERIAAKQVLDVAKVKQFRKDFLMLMSNADRIKDTAMVKEWRGYVLKWRQDFEDYLYKYLLNDLKNLWFKKVITESDSKYWDKKIREETWDFVIAFQVPYWTADEYWTEEQRFLEFQKKLPQWKSKVMGKARGAWRVLEDFVEWYTSSVGEGKSIEVDVPTVEKIEMEGFAVTVMGGESGYQTEEQIEKLKQALRLYKSRAAKIYPWLIQNQLPIVLDFKAGLDKGGEYNHSYILLNGYQGGDVRSVVRVLAHEMAHHRYNTLGSGEQNFWRRMLSGDLGKLDLRDVAKKYPDNMWLFDAKQVKAEDPALYYQLDGLRYNRGVSSKLNEVNTIADLKKYLEDGGEPIVSVQLKPISGYAHKNDAEAFCEALGVLVAYGPNSLPDAVLDWLRVILPSSRTASDYPILAANLPDLQGKYRFWNNKAFGGELPPVKMSWMKSRRSGGTTKATRRGAVITPESIDISSYLVTDEDKLDGILLHEMVHVHTMVKNGTDFGGAHGVFFGANLRDAESKAGRKIPVSDDLDNWEFSEDMPSKKFGVAIWLMKGRPCFQVFNYSSFIRNLESIKQAAISYAERYVRAGYEGDIVLLESEDRDLFRYREQRAFAGWSKVNETLKEKLLNEGKILERIPAIEAPPVSRVATEHEPTIVDVWYDRISKNWVVEVKDERGYQVGEAIYVYTKPEAMREKSRLEREHRIVARLMNATRPIQIDRTEAQKSVDRLMWAIDLTFKENPDGALGTSFEFLDELILRDVSGKDVKVRVLYYAKKTSSSNFVVGGDFKTLKDTGEIALSIILNANHDLFEILSYKSQREGDVLRILMHEISHAADVFDTTPSVKPLIGEGEPGILDKNFYYNHPSEVRAYMRGIFEDIRKSLPVALDHYSLNDAVKKLLRISDTWKQVEGYLTEANRRLVLKGVYQAVEDYVDEQESNKVRVATRPIQIDRASVQKAVDRVIRDLSKGYWDRNPEEPLANSYAFVDRIMVHAVDGRDIEVIVQWKSRGSSSSDLVLGGGSGKTIQTKKPAVMIMLNGNLGAKAFTSTALRDIFVKDAFMTLAHELTHQADVFAVNPSVTTNQRLLKEDEMDLHKYYNNPSEVRAYMLEMAEEMQGYKNYFTFGDANKSFSLFVGWSKTWKRISPYLTDANKHLVLKGVYQAVQDYLEEKKPAEELLKVAKALLAE